MTTTINILSKADLNRALFDAKSSGYFETWKSDYIIEFSNNSGAKIILILDFIIYK